MRLRALKDAPHAFVTTYEQSLDWPDERWLSQLEELHTLVWHEGETDLGMVRGARSSDDPADAYLLSMWVDPSARGRGVGRALVEALIEWAGSEGFRRVLLDVGTSNSSARKLYEACGFTPTGTKWFLPPPREQISEIGMECVLRGASARYR